MGQIIIGKKRVTISHFTQRLAKFFSGSRGSKRPTLQEVAKRGKLATVGCAKEVGEGSTTLTREFKHEPDENKKINGMNNCEIEALYNTLGFPKDNISLQQSPPPLLPWL